MTNQAIEAKTCAKAPGKRRFAREPQAASTAAPQSVGNTQAPVLTANKPTKISAVITLLQREQGATLTEMIAATGWLPHTTRAALTGLKKKGHVLEKAKREDATCYRIMSQG